MKAMLYGSGSGKKPTYAKVHWYASEADMPEVGEDWEIAVITSKEPDAWLISPRTWQHTTTKYFKLLLKTHPCATTIAQINPDTYAALLCAKNAQISDGKYYPTYLYVPKTETGYNGIYYSWLPKNKGKWLRIGRYIFDTDGYGSYNCTLEVTYTETGTELYSTGSVAAGASRMYTTKEKVLIYTNETDNKYAMFGTSAVEYYMYGEYRHLHMLASVDESYDGTRVRMGLIAGQTYTGGNPAKSKYTVYEDFEITAGADVELTMNIPVVSQEYTGTNFFYLAFGAYNAGSTAINIPLRVKRWWLE